MMRALPLAALVLLPSGALAAGNTLTLSGATYDTSAPLFGSGALNGGFATTPPGACYSSPLLTGPFPNTTYPGPTITFQKDVWVKAPTTLPTEPEVIFGDAVSAIGENTSGFPTFQAGGSFVSGTFHYDNHGNAVSEKIADGNWHRLTMNVVQGGSTALSATVIPSFDGVVLGNGGNEFVTHLAPIAFPSPMPPSVFDPAGLRSIVTSIGGGAFTSNAGAAVPNFAGEIDSAACLVGSVPIYTNATTTQPAAGTETGLLGLWNFDQNGNDSATYVPAAAGTAYVIGGTGPAITPGPYVSPATAPSGGFPLSP